MSKLELFLWVLLAAALLYLLYRFLRWVCREIDALPDAMDYSDNDTNTGSWTNHFSDDDTGSGFFDGFGGGESGGGGASSSWDDD